MKLYKTTKQVLSFKAKNIKEFLNGLTSNEMNAINNAFLNIHGRIIATVDQIQITEDEILVCVEKKFVEDVLKHLSKYALLGGVKIEELNSHVYFDIDNSFSVQKEFYIIEQKEGKLIITQNELESNVSDDEFTEFRLDNHIPIQGIDFQDEMLLNVSITNFVSFTKGCFLGQEPISKVYNRSKPSWRLEVKSESDCSEEELEKMTSKSNGRGFVFVKND